MQAQGMIISFSAAPGEPAADGSDKNSPYAKALSKHMLSGQEFDRVLKEVGKDVYRETDNVQQTWRSGSFHHDFYFAPKSMVQETAGIAENVASAPVSSVVRNTPMVPGQIIKQSTAAPVAPVALAATNLAAYTPILPMALPSNGYFSNSEVFAGSAYNGYNDYSKKNIIKRAQGKLSGAGKADGKMGKNTQTALISYQATNTLPITGRLDQGTLTKMGLLGIANESAPVASRSKSSYRRPSTSSTRSSSYNKSKPSSSSGSNGKFNADQFLKNAKAINGAIRRFR